VFRNTGYAFAALLVAAGFAFWPRYLSRLGHDPGIPGYTHFHAAVATVWCLLLIVQPLLVRARRLDLHRRVGVLSWGVGPLVFVASVLLTSSSFRRMDAATFAAEGKFAYIPLHAAILFAWSWALAMVYRRTTALHARFMIATGLVLIDPVGSRLLEFHAAGVVSPWARQVVTFGLTDAILLALAFRPRMTPAARRVFLAGAAAFPLFHVGWFTFAQRPAWFRAAEWFRSLPLT
jgi:hypothetical protein